MQINYTMTSSNLKAMYLYLGLGLAFIYLWAQVDCEDKAPSPTDKKLPKDLNSLTEFDLEKLYDQWEEKDEPLPDDELPPHKRPVKQAPGSNISPTSFKNQEDLMKNLKKGKFLMTFVTVANNPTRREMDELTSRWQTGLFNAHINCQRYIVEDNRAIFAFEDGSKAFEAKKFLLEQPELKEYSIENQVFHGKGYPVEYPHSPTGDSKRSDL